MATKTKPKILFYDIETTPLQAWIWRCGKQVVRHNQLIDGKNAYDIICIGYEFLHGNKKGVLDWGYKAQNSKKMIQEFTEICDEADIIIGKNNKRFDDKHLNTLRLKYNLEGRPDLMRKVDDLETQLRRHFYFPSYGLDYVSSLIGLGGKDNMCFQDWIDIVDKTDNGEKALRKMKKYCAKDVSDTKKIWKYFEDHISPKLKSDHNPLQCPNPDCSSLNTIKWDKRVLVSGVYQRYRCQACARVFRSQFPLKNSK